MNDQQQLFAIFFAIFWGTSANVWPRWKPFQWTLVHKSARVRLRTELSFLCLNLIPLYYFAWIQYALSNSDQYRPYPKFGSVCQLVLSAIIPAFAIFGFYRFWFGLIELGPTCFYYRDEKEIAKDLRRSVLATIEPTIKSLQLRNWGAVPNLLAGLAYIIVSIASLVAFRM